MFWGLEMDGKIIGYFEHHHEFEEAFNYLPWHTKLLGFVVPHPVDLLVEGCQCLCCRDRRKPWMVMKDGLPIDRFATMSEAGKFQVSRFPFGLSKLYFSDPKLLERNSTSKIY